jgi:hypothetical protein
LNKTGWSGQRGGQMTFIWFIVCVVCVALLGFEHSFKKLE